MSVFEGVRIQARVVNALVLRETRSRFGKHQLGYLWAIIDAVFWVMTFYLLFYFLGRRVPVGTDIVSFIATGLIPYMMFRETVEQSRLAIDASKPLLFYPQVRPLDLIIARSILTTATVATVFTLIVGFNALFLGELNVENPVNVITGLVLAGTLGALAGLFFSSLAVFFESVKRIVPIVMRPLFWISGIFFTANELPETVAEVLLWNPILHTVELVRDGWFLEYESRHLNLSYVVFWILGFGYLGLILERLARRRVEVT